MPPDGPDRDETISKNTAVRCANTLNSYNYQVLPRDAIQLNISGYIPVSNMPPPPQPQDEKLNENSLNIISLKKQLECMKAAVSLIHTQIETMEIEITKLTEM